MRRWCQIGLGLGLGLGLGCGEVKRGDATLSVRCDDRAAQLYVDEGYAGLAAATRTRPLAIGAGTHRLELRAEGKLSAYREVLLRRGDHATVEVVLRPDLDQTDLAR